jgi:O-antigen ligase
MPTRTYRLPVAPVRTFTRDGKLGQLAAAAGASVLAGSMLAATDDFTLALALIGLFLLAAIGSLRPALFLTLFLLIRPLVDQVSHVTAAGVPSADAGGALGVALIATAALAMVRAREVQWPSAVPAFLLVLAVSAVSAAQAMFQFGGAIGTLPVTELLRVGSLLAAYVLGGIVFGTIAGSRRLFVVVGLSGVVPALWGILEWITGPGVEPESGLARISGPFVGPVPFGTYLAATALILIFLPANQLRRSVRIPAIVLICAALVGTLSREGWIVLCAGVVVLAWRRRTRLVVVLAVALVALTVLVPTVRERALPAATTATRADREPAYSSWHWRTQNWGSLLREWRRQPVFGYGLRTTEYVNPRAPVSRQGQAGGGYGAHNLVVRVLVEGGVVLLVAYLVFLVALLRNVRRLAVSRWDLQPLGKLLLAVWALLIIVSVGTNDPFEQTALAIPILALTGSLEAARRAAPGRP